MNRRPDDLLAAHRFLPGEKDDAPLLVLLAAGDRERRRLIRFCRGIWRGAPLLVPVLDPAPGRSGKGSQDEEALLVAQLDALIRKAALLYGLELVPAVVVGHGSGADLAVKLALRCGLYLAACILLRPTQPVAAELPGALDGLAVLLGCEGDGDGAGPGTVERQLRWMLAKAGADVITQRVERRGGPGGLDSAICHVFLEALFPPSRFGSATAPG